MQTGRRPSFQPGVEALEDRNLMAAQVSATLAGGVLRVGGTRRDDTIVVWESSGRIGIDHTPIQIAGRGKVGSVPVSSVTRIVILGYEGNDQVTVGDRNLRGPEAVHVPATIWGGAGNDILRGGHNNDLIDGGSGNDQIWGGGGDDTLRGYTGDDRLWGDDGNDRLEGSTGRNGLYGGAGDDHHYSHSPTDDIDGGHGRDAAHLTGAAAGRSTAGLRSIESVDSLSRGPNSTVAPPSRTPTAAPAAGTLNLAAHERRLLELLNAYRVRNGLRALTVDARLTAAARYQANYMARTGHYDHTDLDGRSVADRVTAANYRFSFVAENIHLYDPAVRRTRGVDREYSTAQLAEYFFDGWKASPPHNENLLSPHPVHVGVALAVDGRGRVYADIVLGRP